MRKRLFWDTNIMLDLLGERVPFYEPAAKLATLADKGVVDIIASPLSFATISYILSKVEKPKVVLEKLRKFKIICEVCKLDEQILEKGLNASFDDFEDSLEYFSALDADCDVIITRNAKDLKKSLLPVMSADEYLKSIQK